MHILHPKTAAFLYKVFQLMDVCRVSFIEPFCSHVIQIYTQVDLFLSIDNLPVFLYVTGGTAVSYFSLWLITHLYLGIMSIAMDYVAPLSYLGSFRALLTIALCISGAFVFVTWFPAFWAYVL
jgi:hypothetical protein